MIRRFARSLFVLGAFVSVSSGASAQLAWTELRPVTSPPARYDHALKRIHPSFHVLLFGGRDATQVFSDTWAWTGSNWVLRATSGPPARYDHALADYHFEDDSAVLFGGRGVDDAVLGDTWMWNGTTWSQVNTVIAPSARTGHAMTKDDYALKTVYLFGGRTATGLSNELWRFADGQWSKVTTNAGPSAREGHALVRGADASRFLVIGGKDDSGALADVWEFDGTQWTQTDPMPVPLADAAIVAEDFWRNRPLAFGGETGNATQERLVTGEWVEHATHGSPPPRVDAAIGMDWAMNNSQYVLFGGRRPNGQPLGDTHILRPLTMPFTEQVGTGCGPGAWSLDGGPNVFATMPLLGSELTISALVVKPSIGAFVFGAEFDPSPASDCTLKVSPSLIVPVPVNQVFEGFSVAELNAHIPFVPAFHGMKVPFQVVVSDTDVQGGLSFSGVMRLVLAE
ncbi:MAG: hypothetical protein IPH13_03555 [Planctomycetes bacterium]|nr:hypothetical protein [Planctomycetota bacterium]